MGSEAAQVGVNFDLERVQTLVERGVLDVPPHYIRSQEECPTLDESIATDIPVIDLATSDTSCLTADIGNACREWGIFQVVNHGVPQELLERMLHLAAQFYARPVEEKLKYARTTTKDGEMPHDGYGSRYSQGYPLDWKDYFVHYTLPPSRRIPARWPVDPPHYRSTIDEYSNETIKLARRLLGLISESLGLETKFLEAALGEPYQNIVINYYPPCPQPRRTLGLQAHTDNGGITILLQGDVPGLQVRKDGQWFTVDPIQGALFVNLGDMLQVLSNNRYKSVQHRAIVHKEQPRQSAAAFYNLSQTQRIKPAEPLIDAEHPPVLGEVEFGEHLKAFYSKGRNISTDGKKSIESVRITKCVV